MNSVIEVRTYLLNFHNYEFKSIYIIDKSYPYNFSCHPQTSSNGLIRCCAKKIKGINILNQICLNLRQRLCAGVYLS